MPNKFEVYQSIINPKQFIRLTNLKDALWDYEKFSGDPVDLVVGEWSRGQQLNKEPGISEWTLTSHYRLYTDSMVGGGTVIYSPSLAKVYISSKRKNSDDFLVPQEIMKRLFFLTGF